jgi:hypothetical protein
VTGASKPQIARDASGVWRHASGRPVSRELQAVLGDAVTASGAAPVDRDAVRARNVRHGRALLAAQQVDAARVHLNDLDTPARRAIRDMRARKAAAAVARAARASTAWRVEAARAALTAADRKGRNIGIREGSTWRKR